MNNLLVSLVMKALQRPAADSVSALTKKVTGKPTAKEKQQLSTFVRFIDERRVFYVSYSSEVVECCLASIASFKDETEKALAAVENPYARSAIGAILDATRRFLDKWHGFRTPLRPWDHWPRHHGGDREDDAMAFFEDLGELRMVIKLMVAALIDLAPGTKAPNILAGDPRSLAAGS